MEEERSRPSAELPQGWEYASLSALYAADGFSKDGDWVEKKDQDPTGAVRLTQLADIGEMRFLNKSNRFMDADHARAMDCTFLTPGDVLISRLGEPLGKACLVPTLPNPAVTAVDVHIFRSGSSGASNSYLAYALNSIKVRQAIDLLSSGTTRKRITGKKLQAIKLPIAPLAEQKRIVDKIDALFAQIDAGEKALAEARAGIARYKKSILKAAVTGALTADWREAHRDELEPADVLLARILKERREHWERDQIEKANAKGKPLTGEAWKKKYKEPVAPETDGLPELPEGWVWASVDQLSAFVTSGSRGWAKYYSDSGALFVRVGNFERTSIELNLTDRQHVSPPEGAEGARTRLQPADLLMTITADVGMVAVSPTDVGEAYINQHVSLIRMVDPQLARFVAQMCTAPSLQKRVLETGRGATKDGLTLDDVKGFPIPIAPISEQPIVQSRVAMELDRSAAVDAELEAQQQRSKALRQAVLKAAFEGRLVPQDPNDEPASLLLERIRAEREAQPKPQRRRKAKAGAKS